MSETRDEEERKKRKWVWCINVKTRMKTVNLKEDILLKEEVKYNKEYR